MSDYTSAREQLNDLPECPRCHSKYHPHLYGGEQCPTCWYELPEHNEN